MFVCSGTSFQIYNSFFRTKEMSPLNLRVCARSHNVKRTLPPFPGFFPILSPVARAPSGQVHCSRFSPVSFRVTGSMYDSSVAFIPSLTSHAASLFTSPSASDAMPGCQDWRFAPWASGVDAVFQAHCGGDGQQQVDANWESAVGSFFEDKLGRNGQAWASKVPSLNETTGRDLVDGQLVRFRGMVQDMFDPEYYLRIYAVRDLANAGRVNMRTGKYKDAAEMGAREEILEEEVVHGERLTLHCVSVPGEAPWVRQEHLRLNFRENESKNALKRVRDDEKASMDESMDTTEEGDNKKAKTDEAVDVATGRPTGVTQNVEESKMYTPIASKHSMSCLVKFYPSAGAGESPFAVNDVVEFVGIVSLKPAPDDGAEDGGAHVDVASSQPAVLAPRLHVVAHRTLTHGHPSLPQELPTITSEAEVIRAELKGVLTEALLGDALAAEYLICHLLARVYLRRDVLTLGKFSLNLFNLPREENYGKRLSTIIQLLLCNSHYFPMSVANFNQQTFVPKKDYKLNRLTSGLLQLPKHTHLILDETAMGEGTLQPAGVRNLTALGQLIRWQRLEYDFEFHKLDFEKDVPCLVLSEGRSMLPNDCQVYTYYIFATFLLLSESTFA